MDIIESYRHRATKILPQLKNALEKHFYSNIDFNRIELFKTRIKDVDSFLAKARKKDESGDNIYEDPIWDITDQLAARIVVRFKTELGIIEKMIRQTYRFIEIDPKEPDNPKEFGYFGLHFLLAIPDEIIPQSLDSDDIPQVFELQLKTLFQHAWAEVEHDITYKPTFKWNEEHKRKIAFTAAQAWGADEIFDELYQKRFDSN